MGAPTRTGFTRSYPLLGAMFLDRPRSRGVYTKPLALPRSSSGSSPLARGLRPLPPARRLQLGIVPAPAGFTPQPSHPRSSAPDHPRSRGVYIADAGGSAVPVGSSPLVRGLRVALADVAGEVRIIPARAGFTTSPRPAASRSRDHPRSRGVYHHRRPEPDLELGSSPLAWGLPCLTCQLHDVGRIIPARAGFTVAASGRA